MSVGSLKQVKQVNVFFLFAFANVLKNLLTFNKLLQQWVVQRIPQNWSSDWFAALFSWVFRTGRSMWCRRSHSIRTSPSSWRPTFATFRTGQTGIWVFGRTPVHSYPPSSWQLHVPCRTGDAPAGHSKQLAQLPLTEQGVSFVLLSHHNATHWNLALSLVHLYVTCGISSKATWQRMHACPWDYHPL